MKLHQGLFHFTLNTGNGDIRYYEIFRDGQIQETITKTGKTQFRSTDYVLDKLDIALQLAEKKKNKYGSIPYEGKVFQTEYDLLVSIWNFVQSHTVEEEDIRWF
jgi:hypothetical protein